MKYFFARIFGSYYILALLALFGVWVVMPHAPRPDLQSELAPVAMFAFVFFVISRKFLWQSEHIPSTIRPFLARFFGHWFVAAAWLVAVLWLAVSDDVLFELMVTPMFFIAIAFIITRIYLMSWQAKARQAISNREALRADMQARRKP